MKNLFLFSALVFCSQSKAQLEKNKLLIGGNFSYSDNKTESHDWMQNPAITDNIEHLNQSNSEELFIGFFLSKNLAVGVMGRHSQSDNRYTSIDNGSSVQYYANFYSDNYYNAGAFCRYYIPLLENKCAFFVHTSAAYTNGRTETSNTNSSGVYLNTTQSVSYSEGVIASSRPGFVFFVKNKLGLEMSLGSVYYSYGTSRKSTDGISSGNGKNSSVGANFSVFSPVFGLTYFLGAKKKEGA